MRLGAAWQAKFHRLVALILAGGAGLVVCLTFVWFSAPDLALTQLLVEIVTAVLLLLGLRWLPKRVPFVWTAAGARGAAAPRARPGDRSGLGRRPCRDRLCRDDPPAPTTPSRATSWTRYPEGGGTNVVNVILVDFRGFDTLGEIAVLGVVGLAVFALLRRFRPAPESTEPPPQQKEQSAASAAEDLLVRRSSCASCSPRWRSSRCISCCAATTCPAAASSPGS